MGIFTQETQVIDFLGYGIVSEEQWGLCSITTGNVIVSVKSIPSGESWGNPTVVGS